jgi:hypothetical protein
VPRGYYLGADNHVYELAWVLDEWHVSDLFTRTKEAATVAATGSALIAFGVGVGNGDPRVYYLGANEHVYELAWVLDEWHVSDLFTRTVEPATATATGSALTGFGVDGFADFEPGEL